MNAQVSARLGQLKLSGMAGALEDQQVQPATYEVLSFLDRLIRNVRRGNGASSSA